MMAMRRLLGSRQTPCLVNGIRLFYSRIIASAEIVDGVVRAKIHDHEAIRRCQEWRFISPTPEMIPYTARRKAFENAVGLNADPDFCFGPGSDFEHWQVYTKPLRGSPPKNVILRYYFQTLAQVLGSEEAAINKIYSVATRHYYAFGAKFSAELADELKGLPNVCLVLQDEYVNSKEKRYPWDPFINGIALPYDSKYYPEGEELSFTDEEMGTANNQHIPDNRCYAEVDNGFGIQMTGLPSNDVASELAQ